MHVPLLFSFWFTVAAYVVHCIDESLLGGSFVEKVRQHWWTEYSWTMFFWFDSAYFVVMLDDPAASLGDRMRMQRSLARRLVDSLPRIFARASSRAS